MDPDLAAQHSSSTNFTNLKLLLNSYLQKIHLSPFLVIILSIILLIFVLIGVYLFNFTFRKEKPISDITEKPGIVRVETLPPQYNNQIGTQEFDAFGISKIITNGTVKEIIKPGESYKLQLDSKEIITATIDSKTLLGKAWFEINQEGIILRSSAKPITKEEFITQLSLDKKVKITYSKDRLNSQNQVKIEEFILID